MSMCFATMHVWCPRMISYGISTLELDLKTCVSHYIGYCDLNPHPLHEKVLFMLISPFQICSIISYYLIMLIYNFLY